MKKLLLALTIIFTFSITLVNAQSCHTFTSSISIGSRGTEVTRLQSYLFSQGYLPVAPTGYFGNLTHNAVKQYQASKGLDTVGNVGPLTRQALSVDTCSYSSNTNTQEYNSNLYTNTQATNNNYTVPVSFTSLDEVVTLNIPYGSLLNLPTLQTRTKYPTYTFSGWYSDPTYTTQYNSQLPVSNSVSLYAKWLKNCPNKLVAVFPSGCETNNAATSANVSNQTSQIINESVKYQPQEVASTDSSRKACIYGGHRFTVPINTSCPTFNFVDNTNNTSVKPVITDYSKTIEQGGTGYIIGKNLNTNLDITFSSIKYNLTNIQTSSNNDGTVKISFTLPENVMPGIYSVKNGNSDAVLITINYKYANIVLNSISSNKVKAGEQITLYGQNLDHTVPLIFENTATGEKSLAMVHEKRVSDDRKSMVFSVQNYPGSYNISIGDSNKLQVVIDEVVPQINNLGMFKDTEGNYILTSVENMDTSPSISLYGIGLYLGVKAKLDNQEFYLPNGASFGAEGDNITFALPVKYKDLSYGKHTISYGKSNAVEFLFVSKDDYKFEVVNGIGVYKKAK